VGMGYVDVLRNRYLLLGPIPIPTFPLKGKELCATWLRVVFKRNETLH
jgi:hypothetical protein